MDRYLRIDCDRRFEPFDILDRLVFLGEYRRCILHPVPHFFSGHDASPFPKEVTKIGAGKNFFSLSFVKAKDNKMATWCIDEADGSKSLFIHLPGVAAKSGQKMYDELSKIPDSEWIQGKFMQHLTPRLVRWHSMTGNTYKFSGRKYESMPYSPHLLQFSEDLPALIRSMIPQGSLQGIALDYNALNSVLINKYRDNTDSISPHADNEPEFGKHPTIVSVNFGVPRKFVLKPMTDTQRKKEWEKTGKRDFRPTPAKAKKAKIEIRLDHGDVLIMAGAAQEFWYHEVPKEKELEAVERMQLMPGKERLMKVRPTAVRFNLTFRPRVIL